MSNRKSIIALLLALLTASTAMAYIPPKRVHPEVSYNTFKLHHTMLPQVGELATKNADGKSNLRWSVGCETLDRDYATFEGYKHFLNPLGVGRARLQSGWAKCEKQKGVYDFAWLDEHVNGCLEQGVQPWLSLSYGNPIYSKDGVTLNSSIWTDEETMTAWCNYVRAIVRHYGEKVMLYEVWNEPDGKKENTPAIVAQLLMRTGEVIRQENPKAEIIAFGLCKDQMCNYTAEVLDILKKNKKLDVFDRISFHLYFENPDNATERIKELRRVVKSYDKRLDIFQGESGCPSTIEYGHALKYKQWSEFKQVKWVLRRFANDFANDIPSSIFTLVDLQYPNMLQSFGLVRMNLMHQPMYKRPSYYGVQHLMSLLNDEFHAVELKCEAHSNREVRCVGVANSKNEVVGAMLWYSDQTPTDQLDKDNVSMTIYDFDAANCVYVEPITGYVHSLDTVVTKGANDGKTARFSGLPMWDSPIFVIKKSAINLK